VYTHGLTYGALATPITFLLFYYMMSLAIVLGAQFNNATLEFFPARISRRELRKWRRYEVSGDEVPVAPSSTSPQAAPQHAAAKSGRPTDQLPGSDR
jgi:membrane protein